jgi:hypothetical protein
VGWLNRDGVIGVDRVGMVGWRDEERMRRWKRKGGGDGWWGGEKRNEAQKPSRLASTIPIFNKPNHTSTMNQEIFMQPFHFYHCA